MTIKHLALDRAGQTAPDGLVVGMADSVADLRAAGFAAAAYTGTRLAQVDTADANAWNADAQPGWYWISGATVRTPPVAPADQVAADVLLLQAAVNREAEDLERILAREAMSPHTDSGHKWSNDLLHALVKPNIRLLVLGLTAAKAAPSSTTIAAYRDGLDRFVAIADDPGLVGLYDGADKAVWRPKRDGSGAYGYDVDTGGVRQASGADVMANVSYPDGESVATWDALAAVENL